MNWEMIFKIVNIGVLPFWLLLAFGPRGIFMGRFIFVAGTGLLALAYAVLMIGFLSGLISSGAGVQSGSVDLMTLGGVMTFFDTQAGTTIGWIHYLAFDLFVGIWIARNADRHGISRLLQVPILALTLLFGPIGLLLYLIIRAAIGKKLENGFVPR
jgi:hypothetical protein